MTLRFRDDRIDWLLREEPDVRELLLELAEFHGMLDSVAPPSDTAAGVSAEPSSPVEARRWAAGVWSSLLRDVRALTWKTQRASQIPAEQRTIVDQSSGRCLFCKSRVHGRVRTHRHAAGTRPKDRQLELITELAVDLFGSVQKMLDELRIGSLEDLDRDEAARLLRILRRREPAAG